MELKSDEVVVNEKFLKDLQSYLELSADEIDTPGGIGNDKMKEASYLYYVLKAKAEYLLNTIAQNK